MGLLAFAFPLAMALWDIDDKIAVAFPVSAPYLIWIPWVSLALGILLIITAFVELISWWIELWYRLMPSALRNVSVTICKADDLPNIVSIASSRIGNTTDLEKTRQLYNHNSRSIWKVRNTISGKVIGYYCLLPLTQKGEQKVLDRDLLLGDLDIECFAKRFRKHGPVYIGGIAGLNKKAGAAALEQMKHLIVKLEASKAYARPATDDGVRLVKRYGFEPVSAHDKVAVGTYVCRIRNF